MRNKEYQSIVKMIEYINRAERYTSNFTFEEFSNNNMVIDATVLVISQMGELVKNLDKDFQKQYSSIRWNILKGLRNRIVHDYEGINLEIIWSIVKRDVPRLKIDLQKIINHEIME